ncbi:hypothetical protein A2634_04330 [Candidatus Amesbacteria bacterium RIFCSPHIGHO2_01_FULL_48_32]|uniref:Uncharacterized protein n=1 Tax=Candidatus Amesbacteria bacterium RIFCSPLOWO2_01_FULL_48_25 TaxID=1797259 RepID=A0A1F4ZC59_9BACT|nr:MAG: hypothetical protein A2634_04330 [Candidatus Amesbacteria bacterium RIFCSPHIGHO2_01_FULL_48_32]OGD03778.1 MAG: hypothetical protein A2989_03795 [Candidatus Amesbacteria bacterium RIFCSPLOWO2_01_FULL_48_25]HJZ05116.1 hypothetical protein [Patescibacteria group bacterium]
MSYPPKVGIAGAVHHERESFRSGWEKARELLGQKVYRGEIPAGDLELLSAWYVIRSELLVSRDGKAFDKRRVEFESGLPEGNDKLDNAIVLITQIMAENGI